MGHIYSFDTPLNILFIYPPQISICMNQHTSILGTDRKMRFKKAKRIILSNKHGRLGSIFGVKAFDYTVYATEVFVRVNRTYLWLTRPMKITTERID